MAPAGTRWRPPYWIRFVFVTATLIAVTGLLVLVVMPRRFVLEAGFRESGMSFPTARVGFRRPEPAPLVSPPPPPARPAPGPAELLWAELDPLLAAGQRDSALVLMEAYLADRPGDLAVRRQRARTLAALGRRDAAIAEWRDILAASGARADRLALARLLRDTEAFEEAATRYRELLAARPADDDLRHEYARTLVWAERYGAAEVELRDLLSRRPSDDELRLELARVLYWSGRPDEARAVLAAVPPQSPHATEARKLDAELAALLATPPAPEPVPPTLVERARTALEEGRMDEAERLYRQAIDAAPDDAALREEWIDVLQYRLEDLEAARDALLLHAERTELSTDQKIRLAELHAWTGQEAEARAILEQVVAEEPGRSDAWAFLGDLRRWNDEPVAAATAYREAQEVDPRSPRARAGLEALRIRRERLVAEREPTGGGPASSLFSDSDEFLRLDVAGDAAFRWSLSSLRARAGYRRLEGFDLAGVETEDDGFFGEVELARWWREASLRTAVTVGAEELADAGFEPWAALEVHAPDAGGFSLTGRLETGPAHPLTATLESVIEPVRADRLQVSLFRPLGERWTLGVSLDGGLLSGADDTNARFAGWASLSRQVTDVLSVELGTSLIGFGDAAPAPTGRRLYWDPRLFWATTASLTAASRPVRGWGWRARVTGGAAYADERDAPDTEWIPQLGLEGGIVLRGARQDLRLDAFYRQSREDDYSAWGLDFSILVRP
ncbi:MAG: tetratricopeptide repeat protein [Gemmatimonadota bacterium]|nr:tetratricopeptide repeat protein [Gemmatimonadota bacterium]